ncbi:MAG: phosphate signaling complex protein PhoU [Verrucomicrobiales bacterium]
MERHILGSFDEALDNLRDQSLLMASLTERALDSAQKGFMERHLDSCNNVIAGDYEIDQLEIRIDESGVQLLTFFQPVASDLRVVIAQMKLSQHLERIADQCVNIARKARKLLERPTLKETAIIEPLFTYAGTMLKDALQVQIHRQADDAIEVVARDRHLDEMNRLVAEQLTNRISVDPNRTWEHVQLIFIAGHLERIGDLSKSIAQDAVFLVEGRDIRHQNLAQV